MRGYSQFKRNFSGCHHYDHSKATAKKGASLRTPNLDWGYFLVSDSFSHFAYADLIDFTSVLVNE